MEGDRRVKKLNRDVARQSQKNIIDDEGYNKYSRTFRKARVDPLTLKVDLESNDLSPQNLRDLSQRRPSFRQTDGVSIFPPLPPGYLTKRRGSVSKTGGKTLGLTREDTQTRRSSFNAPTGEGLLPLIDSDSFQRRRSSVS